jgi:hypothetical protein
LSYEPGGKPPVSLHIEEPPFLTAVNARELLLASAEVRDCDMPPGVTAIVDNLVEHCSGLPLALAVLGGTLRGTDSSAWGTKLASLRQSGLADDRVTGVCQWSVDALPPSLRRCFADLAALPQATRTREEQLVTLFAAHAPLASPLGSATAALILQELERCSLVLRAVAGWHGAEYFESVTYRVHDVLHGIAVLEATR